MTENKQPEGEWRRKEDFLHDEFPQIKQQVKVNPDYILDKRSLRAMQAYADQEVKKVDQLLNQQMIENLMAVRKLETQIESLQAYNGKLVQALKWLEQHYMNILNSDDYANIGIEKIEQSLSSFTDKEIKP
jgi:hypothetical protein